MKQIANTTIVRVHQQLIYFRVYTMFGASTPLRYGIAYSQRRVSLSVYDVQ